MTNPNEKGPLVYPICHSGGKTNPAEKFNYFLCSKGKFENRRFSFYNLAEREHT